MSLPTSSTLDHPACFSRPVQSSNTPEITRSLLSKAIHQPENSPNQSTRRPNRRHLPAPMNNNVVIAVVLLVALFGCACGWLYSLRWRSEVREQLFEADATVRIRRLERRATQPRRAVEGRTGGQPSPASRPAKTKGGSKKKNKGKKPSTKPKQRPQQQEWSSDNQQDGQEGITDTYNQDQARDQDQDQDQDQDCSSPWGSVDLVDQSEANPSATSTTTADTAADDYSAPEASGQASESDGRWSDNQATASAASEWPTGGNSSSGQEWESDGQLEDDQRKNVPASGW